MIENGCESTTQCIPSVTSSLLQSDDMDVASSTLPSSTLSSFSYSSSDSTTLTLTADSKVDEIPDTVYENEPTCCNCGEIKRLKAENEYLKTEITSLKETATYFNQECLRLSKENMVLKNKLDKSAFTVSNLDEKKLKFFTGKNKSLELENCKQVFFLYQAIGKEIIIFLFSGIRSFLIFNWVVSLVIYRLPSLCKKLTPADKVLLILIKLRLALENKDLAYRQVYIPQSFTMLYLLI